MMPGQEGRIRCKQYRVLKKKEDKGEWQELKWKYQLLRWMGTR